MGCTSSDIVPDNERNNKKFNDNSNSRIASDYNLSNNDYIIPKKHNKSVDEKVLEDPNLTKEQIDIIKQFNSKYRNSKGIQLSTLSKYQILSSQENTSVIAIQS